MLQNLTTDDVFFKGVTSYSRKTKPSYILHVVYDDRSGKHSTPVSDKGAGAAVRKKTPVKNK